MIREKQPALHEEFEKLGLELVTPGFLAHLELTPTLFDQIKEAQKGHDSIEGIKKKIPLGKAPKFSADDEGVLWFDGRLCVPDVKELKLTILKEAHDTPYSIHPGVTKMYEDLKDLFWWHGMKSEIALYVAKCDICQRVKAEHKRPAGLLQPLRVPELKWEQIGMDFITGLPRSSKGHIFWVIVD